MEHAPLLERLRTIDHDICGNKNCEEKSQPLYSSNRRFLCVLPLVVVVKSVRQRRGGGTKKRVVFLMP